MITPNEIKGLCLKWWREVLLSAIDGGNCFPKEITRIGKISPKDILTKLTEHKSSIQLLRDNSKDYRGYGYNVILIEKQFEKIGRQQVPEKITIETIEDFLKYISKEKEYARFSSNLNLITAELPILVEWIKSNPLRLIEHDTWRDTLKVCQYFIENPQPNLYIRQLPIEVHTKYIQANKQLMQSLLEFLIPKSINYSENRFELRFNLKYAEPLIRIRFLDQETSPLSEVSDMSLPLSEFSVFKCICKNVLVTENIMNFLALPSLPQTVAIWSGGGFSVSYLKDIGWLKDKQFYYWGDIDAHGFQILNQFRTYFPNTVTLMMDEKTLKCFKPAEGEPCTNQNLPMLTTEEHNLYQYLRENNLRLEQEKITQAYAEDKLFRIVGYKAYLNAQNQ
jgi:hypothetical protein